VFSLYVQTMDELDDENILSVIRSIPDHFVNIFALWLYVGDCTIHLVRPPSILSLCLLTASIDDIAIKKPEALASVLSCFTEELQELVFRFWKWPSSDDKLAHLYRSQTLKLCKVWSEQCPSLAWIRFPDNDCRHIDLGWDSEDEESGEY